MNIAKVKLLGHASILIEVDNKRILTDPWYFGTAFNDGWELLPRPNLEDIKSDIKNVDIIWISHEHPDHLHFPTLKWIAEFVQNDVEIYFQKNNSSKVFEALKKLGYKKFVSMPHLAKISITPNVNIACYAHRQLDSSLAVFIKNKFWLLNINDTELNQHDISIIRKKFGIPTALYNQFSIAGSDGIENNLKFTAASTLKKMREHHESLSAKVSIPFASFIRFARVDNKYMNDYVNTVFDVKNQFKENNLQVILQAFGGEYLKWSNINEVPWNWVEIDAQGEKFFKDKIEPKEDNEYQYKIIMKDEMIKVIEDRVKSWKKVTSRLVWKILKLDAVFFKVTDWDNEIWKVDFDKNLFSKASNIDEFDISISSQPLWQAFKMPFGIQTLGVSGRYKFSKKNYHVPKKWKKIRILSSLYNAEIYLSISGIFSRQMINWIWKRREGLVSQIIQQFARFKGS